MNFRVFDSREDLVRGAASAIARSIETHERSVVSLSGGSTPAPIYELLSDAVNSSLAGREVVWVTGDERDAPHGDPASNRSMIERSLFRNGVPAAHRFLYFDTSKAGREEVAAAFENEWRQAGIDHLTLSILGVGDDAHTASLFPGTSGLDVTDRIAIANFVPQLDSWRYTLTFPVIQGSAETIVLAVGEKKRAVIAQAESGEDLPVVRALRGAGRRWWFVDREARPDVVPVTKSKESEVAT